MDKKRVANKRWFKIFLVKRRDATANIVVSDLESKY